jgi:hypothetical protein
VEKFEAVTDSIVEWRRSLKYMPHDPLKVPVIANAVKKLFQDNRKEDKNEKEFDIHNIRHLVDLMYHDPSQANTGSC